MNLELRLRAQIIKRYHTAPIIGEQTVGEHTFGVVQILRYIMDDNVSINLYKAALDHDVTEHFTGDYPHPTKRDFPEIKAVLNEVENYLCGVHMLGHDDLTEKEVVCLKAADWIESALFGMRQAKLGNDYGLFIMKNIFNAFAKLPSHIVPQKAKDLVIELENYHVSKL